MRRPIVNAIWIGKKMGPIHAACLKSFLVTGHHVVLHSYGPVEDAPPGVRYRDANKLLPEPQLLRYPNGSYAISSNLMRYEIMRQGIGLYVDCDVFCLRPMEDADYIFGWEGYKEVNTAVLKLPRVSPITMDMCSIRPGWMPPWPKYWWEPDREGLKLEELPWGFTGPHALTYFVKQHHLEQLARQVDVFYPVPQDRWNLLYDPDLTIGDVTTSRTHYVHLYHQTQAERGPYEVPPTSPLGRMMQMVEGEIGSHQRAR